MKWLKHVLDFYLDASVHVALAVFALLKMSGLILGFFVNWNLSFFVFFGSIACYNFVKYGVEAKKYILVANRYHKGIQFFSIISLVCALYNGYFLNLLTWLSIGGLMLLIGLYALPVLPKARNLRSWGGFKIFIVAAVWAGVTVILPVVSSEKEIAWDAVIETLQRFVLVFILLVPFEIRDLRYDLPELKTLPQRFGVTGTKLFGAIAALVFFLMTFLKDGISDKELILKGVLVLVLGAVIYKTKKNQSKYFTSLWVESIPIFWWILALSLIK